MIEGWERVTTGMTVLGIRLRITEELMAIQTKFIPSSVSGAYKGPQRFKSFNWEAPSFCIFIPRLLLGKHLFETRVQFLRFRALLRRSKASSDDRNMVQAFQMRLHTRRQLNSQRVIPFVPRACLISTMSSR